MEPSEIDRLKEQAVNAMTGHMPCTPDSLYDLGKALESVCEEVKRLKDAEDDNNTLREQVALMEEEVADLRNLIAKIKELCS